jgi:hypothetical protein
VFVTPHFVLLPRQPGVSEGAFKAMFVASSTSTLWEACKLVVMRGAADVGGADGGSGSGELLSTRRERGCVATGAGGRCVRA